MFSVEDVSTPCTESSCNNNSLSRLSQPHLPPQGWNLCTFFHFHNDTIVIFTLPIGDITKFLRGLLWGIAPSLLSTTFWPWGDRPHHPHAVGAYELAKTTLRHLCEHSAYFYVIGLVFEAWFDFSHHDSCTSIKLKLYNSVWLVSVFAAYYQITVFCKEFS